MNYHTSIQTKSQKQLTNISFRRKVIMGLAKAIKRGASALLIGSMMTGLLQAAQRPVKTVEVN